MANTGGLTRAREALALDAIMADTSIFPATFYMALFTVNPTTDTGTGLTEVTGGSYAREAVTEADFAAAVAGSGTAPTTKENDTAITFTSPTADWAAGSTKVVGFGFYTASSGGTLIYTGELDTPRNILSGDTVEFAVGSIRVPFGNPDDAYTAV